MTKLLQFLNKYLFIFLVLAYLLNKYANPDVASQYQILQILVVIMFVNLFIKFYFLRIQDKTEGSNRFKWGIIVLITSVIFLVVYAYFRGLFSFI